MDLLLTTFILQINYAGSALVLYGAPILLIAVLAVPYLLLSETDEEQLTEKEYVTTSYVSMCVCVCVFISFFLHMSSYYVHLSEFSGIVLCRSFAMMR